MGPGVNDLVLHAFDPATVPAGIALHADVDRQGSRLSLRWTLIAQPRAVAIATRTAPPARRDRLWTTTCFEVFLAPAGGPEYWEVNLSPRGDWNVYRFDGERTGMRAEPRVAAPLVHTATAANGRFTLTAGLDLAPVPALADAPLDVAVTAVLEAASGVRSYWALRHARPQPDFHARETFVVRLAR